MEKNGGKNYYNSIDRLAQEIEILQYYVSQIDKYSEIITKFYIELTEYNSKFLHDKFNILAKKQDPLYNIGLSIKNAIGEQISSLGSIHKMNTNIFEPMKKSIEKINKKKQENPEKFDVKYNTSDSGDQIKLIFDELFKFYGNIEKKIADDYIHKKYNRRVAGLDASIKLEGNDNIIETVKSLEGSFASFTDYKKQNLAEGMKYSNDFSKEIITTAANSVKNYFDLMKTNYINILNQIDIESKKIDDISKCNSFNNLSSDLISDEFGYFKYNINVINQPQIKVVPLENDKNESTLSLNEEDVYNIVKKIYEYDFKMVNTTNYNLEEELQNLEIIQLTNKLVNYEEDVNASKTPISNDEINTLYDLMNGYKHLSAFFMTLNNYRTVGKYEMPKNVFDIITNIFIKGFEFLTKNDDIKFTTLLIILSQTFYNIENGEKKFLLKNLGNIPLLSSVEFWSKLIEGVIQEELEKAITDEKRLGVIVNDERRKTKNSELVFLKLTPLIYNMKDFELDKQKINEIIQPFIDKYIVTKESKEIIMSLINN